MFGFHRTSRGRARVLGALLTTLCAPAFCALPARASVLQLAWTAPSSCPSERDVQARIDALLGTAASSASNVQTVHASGVVREGQGGYKLELTLSGGEVAGTRQLSGHDCAALAETAAFLVAVAIDPSLPGTKPQPEPPPPPVASPEPPVPPPPAPAVPPPAPPSWRDQHELALQADGFGGLWRGYPTPQAQFGVSVGARLDSHVIEARFGYALKALNEFADPYAEGKLETDTLSYELAVCEQFGRRFFAGPCIGLALLHSHGQGIRFSTTDDHWQLWGSVSAALQAGLQLNAWLAVWGEAGVGTAIFRRPRFTATTPEGFVRHIDAERYPFYGRLGVRFQWRLLTPGAKR